MAEQRAFLALEGTISATMLAVFEPYGHEVVRNIKALIDREDWTGAFAAAQAINLDGVVTKNRARLEELAVSCLLHGASQVKPLRETALNTGAIPVPHEMHRAIDQLIIMVEQDAAEFLRKMVGKMITDAQQAHADGSIRKAEATDTFDIIDQLNAAAMGTGKGLIDISANLTTSRLISYGFLAQAIESNVETYQVSEVLDARICPVCKVMHGKIFNVAREKAQLDQVLSTSDPAELKSLAPWPSQSGASVKQLASTTVQQLQAMGLGSPPYHPLCRGTIQMTGSVSQIDIQPVALPPTLLDDLKSILSPSVTETPKKKPKAAPAKKPIKALIDEHKLSELIAQIPSMKVMQQAQAALQAGKIAKVKSILQTYGLYDSSAQG